MIFYNQIEPQDLSLPSLPVCCLCPRRKVAKAYFALLEVLCHNHTGTIACQDSPTFAFILNSLDQVRARACGCLCVFGDGVLILGENARGRGREKDCVWGSRGGCQQVGCLVLIQSLS
jgi:hypothetical protein